MHSSWTSASLASTFAFFFLTTQFTCSPKHIKVRVCKQSLVCLLVNFYLIIKRDKLQNIHRWHIRQAHVMMARDGSSILPWSVFGCYLEKTLWFVIPQRKNTLIKPSAHGIPVVFCSWMLSLEGLIVLHLYLPKTHHLCWMEDHSNSIQLCSGSSSICTGFTRMTVSNAWPNIHTVYMLQMVLTAE